MLGEFNGTYDNNIYYGIIDSHSLGTGKREETEQLVLEIPYFNNIIEDCSHDIPIEICDSHTRGDASTDHQIISF